MVIKCDFGNCQKEAEYEAENDGETIHICDSDRRLFREQLDAKGYDIEEI